MDKKFSILVVIILSLGLMGCSEDAEDISQEIITPSPPVEKNQEVELNLQDVTVVLQSFKTVFGRDLRVNLDYETEKYRVFTDPSIYVFEIKDQDDYILDYNDLFNFVKSEADQVLNDFKEGDNSTNENEYPEYVYRYILENEGPASHEFIKRHVLWAYLDRKNLLDHTYYQWTYDYCAPNIVVKIKAKRSFGGKESYSSYSDFFENAELHGEEYVGGLKVKGNLKRPPIGENYESLREDGACAKIPESFDNTFDNLREDWVEEIGVTGKKTKEIDAPSVEDFQQNSFEGACPPKTTECDQTWWLAHDMEEISGTEYYVYKCDYFTEENGKVYKKNRYCEGLQEICNDWQDNDDDNKMDCADLDCKSDPYCM